MSFRRCHMILPGTPLIRKVTRDLIVRCISKSNRFDRCSSRDIDSDTADSSISNNLSKYTKDDNRGYTLESRSNLNENINAAVPLSIQRIGNCLNDEFILDDSNITLPRALDTCTEDLSDVGPYLTPTFTFAKYANKSRTIQELVKLGVGLYKFESKTEMIQYILSLDFDKDVKPYIRFLCDCGVPANYLGEFITKNPDIFKEDMDDLHTRIRYLRAHEFDVDMIKAIICKNPKWLMYSTKDIDSRLGYFQSNFKLNGYQVRRLTVRGAKVVTYKMTHLLENTFSIKEEMGFHLQHLQALLLNVPKIWVKNRERLVAVFDYAHNEMGLQRDCIVKSPQILLCRKNRLEHRHSFLVELKRAQYDSSKPMYVSPQSLVSGTDAEFCRDTAKTSIDIYNAYLKTF